MGRSNQEILMDLIIKAMEAGKKVGDKKMPKKTHWRYLPDKIHNLAQMVLDRMIPDAERAKKERLLFGPSRVQTYTVKEALEAQKKRLWHKPRQQS